MGRASVPSGEEDFFFQATQLLTGGFVYERHDRASLRSMSGHDAQFSAKPKTVKCAGLFQR